MIAKKIFIALLIVMPLVPFVAVAATGGTPYKTPSIWPLGYWGPFVSCTGSYVANSNQVAVNGSQPATCDNLCDILDTFLNIVYFGMSLAIFIIAPILFVTGGIMVMISGANPEMLSQGKKTLTGTLIGLLIVLCAYLIVNTVLFALSVTSVGGFNSGPSICQVK